MDQSGPRIMYSVPEAARQLSISRSTLFDLLRRHQIVGVKFARCGFRALQRGQKVTTVPIGDWWREDDPRRAATMAAGEARGESRRSRRR